MLIRQPLTITAWKKEKKIIKNKIQTWNTKDLLEIYLKRATNKKYKKKQIVYKNFFFLLNTSFIFLIILKNQANLDAIFTYECTTTAFSFEYLAHQFKFSIQKQKQKKSK